MANQGVIHVCNATYCDTDDGCQNIQALLKITNKTSVHVKILVVVSIHQDIGALNLC